MSAAVEKLKAGIAYKRKSLEALKINISIHEDVIRQAEETETRLHAGGKSDAEIDAAIMAMFPARFRCTRTNERYNLPVNPAKKYFIERAILQALIHGPVEAKDLREKTGLKNISHGPTKIKKTLAQLREAGIVKMTMDDRSRTWLSLVEEPK